MIRESGRRIVGKHSETIQLSRYNCLTCYVSNISALFKTYLCPSCEDFINRAPKQERHLTTCEERVEHVFPKNVNPLRETVFDKIDSFNIPCSDDQKLFQTMAVLDFQAICVQGDKVRDTVTTTWIGKHVRVSVSVPSNLMEQPIFLCNFNTGALVEPFFDAIDGLAI